MDLALALGSGYLAWLYLRKHDPRREDDERSSVTSQGAGSEVLGSDEVVRPAAAQAKGVGDRGRLGGIDVLVCEPQDRARVRRAFGARGTAVVDADERADVGGARHSERRFCRVQLPELAFHRAADPVG